MAQLIMKLTTIRQNELLMGSVHLRLQEEAGPGGGNVRGSEEEDERRGRGRQGGSVTRFHCAYFRFFPRLIISPIV